VTDPDDGNAPDSTPVDPDDEPKAPGQRRTPVARVLAVIAIGGVLGAEARHGLGVAIPHAAGQWPWATFLTNASGCLLIGVLMVVILELSTPHPLVRPLLGVGVLGGYTTFSTYSVDTLDLLQHGHTALALAYFVGTPLVALVAVTGGVALTRAGDRALHRRRARP
jgi:CrcB protein